MVPFTLSLLFTLALSLFPVTPTLGSNLPPGVTLQPLNTLPNLAPNSLVRYSHTFLVGSNGSPTENGNALLAAMSVISSANPSAANPYLLKLEPGQYDLGNQSLTLRPYVDLEGSGEGTTAISSTLGNTPFLPSSGTLVAASNSEVRFVKITNSSTATYQAAVLIPDNTTNARFNHLTAAASGGSNSYGLKSEGGAVTLTASTVTASGSFTNYGFYSSVDVSGGGGIAIVTDATVTASGGFNTNVALYNNQGTLNLTNSTLTAATVSASGGSDSVGFFNAGGAATIAVSSLTASGSSQNYSLDNIGTATVTASSLTASGGSGSSNAGLLTGTGTAIVTNSTLTASGGIQSYGFFFTGGVARVTSSQLTGNSGASNGLSNCPFSVKVAGGLFVPLNNSCN
jgi:hypothetical protein